MITGALPTTVIVMGVSASGKTTVAEELAGRLGWEFAEGDDFHPEANVAKMRAGQPLDDEDRWPWLRELGSFIGEREIDGRNLVMTCSALKRSYRDVLRDGRETVWFVHVDVAREELERRLRERRGHYMPPSLLDSQLAALQPLGDDEPGTTVPGDGAIDAVIEHVIAALRAERGLR